MPGIAQNLSVNQVSIIIETIETHHLGDHEPRRRAGRSGDLVAAAARICVDVHHVAAVAGGHVSLLRRWWLVFHLHLGCWLLVLVALRVCVLATKKTTVCLSAVRNPIQDAVLAQSKVRRMNLFTLLFGLTRPSLGLRFRGGDFCFASSMQAKR